MCILCPKCNCRHSSKKSTSSFIINGTPASRIQFPLINAYALTVHKVQGLTLPDISLNLDSQMFEKEQAYVAITGMMLKLNL